MTGDKRSAIIRSRVVIDQAAMTTAKRYNIVADAEILRELIDLESQQLRASKLCHERLSRLQFQIDGYELLAGRIRQNKYTDKEFAQANEFLQNSPPSGGQTGHCAVYYEEVFDIGIGGLLKKIAKLQIESEGEQAETYQSFIYALQGLQKMIVNAAKPVEAALASASPERIIELQEILDSCTRLKNNPPKNFRDAVQLLWFIAMGIETGDSIVFVGPGMMDRHFARFIEESDDFNDKALELIEAYYFLINDFSTHGGAHAVMVGGINAKSENICNKLSYLCVEALRRTNLVYPTVGVCWHENTTDDLIDLTLDLITSGYSTPAFFGDAVIRKGLIGYGMPETEACDYINSTCVEITPYGSSNVWVASPYFSLCGILMEMFEKNINYESYDDLFFNYCKMLGEKITQGVVRENKLRELRRLNNRNPLQSVFTLDCISQGRDIDDGGARYNWVECSFVGLANLVDSLKVINEEVFGSGELSLAQLKQILDSNFSNNEQFRQKLLNKYPKYGLNDSHLDSEINRIMEIITTECSKHKMLPDNSHFIPGTFCFVMHQRFGAECGATPDGRKAGFPFADGAGPAQGREKLGPTAAINSVTSWDHSPMIGGSAFNMKFNSSIFKTPGSVEKLKQLILVFLNQGGFETQINVVDNSTLKEALANPEQYNDLVVRIGGYTDYFTRLSPEMQQEVLQRTEYNEL